MFLWREEPDPIKSSLTVHLIRTRDLPVNEIQARTPRTGDQRRRQGDLSTAAAAPPDLNGKKQQSGFRPQRLQGELEFGRNLAVSDVNTKPVF